MGTMTDLTICTNIIPSDKFYFDLNRKLVARLNGADPWHWIVGMDNNEGPPSDKISPFKDERFTFVDIDDEDIRRASRWGAQYHFSLGVNKVLGHVKTRFLLILDPDFYIVFPEWIKEVTGYMEKQGLSFFGAPWHVKWYMKFRYFPCVQCLFIDLDKIPIDTLDFMPLQLPALEDENTPAWRRGGKQLLGRMPRAVTALKNYLWWLGPNRALKCTPEEEVGGLLYLRYSNHRDHPAECLTPVYNPQKDFLGPQGFFGDLNVFIEKFLPDRLSYIPKGKGAYMSHGFQESGYPDTTRLGWEEFMWKERPFALHVRRYPKRNLNLEQQKGILVETLERFRA